MINELVVNYLVRIRLQVQFINILTFSEIDESFNLGQTVNDLRIIPCASLHMIFSLEKTKHTDEKKRINRCAAQSPLSELQCPLRSSHANPRRFKREPGVRFRVHIDWQVGGSMQSGIADTAIICARALPSSTSHPRPGPLY